MNTKVETHDEPHTLLDDTFFVSGHIPRTHFTYETGMAPSHVTQNRRDGSWQSDTKIADERYVACYVKNRGLVVFSACSHAGINNVCQDAQNQWKNPRIPIFGIMGGLHLVGKSIEERIDLTVTDLQEKIQPSVIIGGHCTGWRGKAQLANAFPNSFQPLAVGGSYVFRS
jgi:7,8-dihydropterin-6-yl-methyl-4-(beta-D-ribofuranosyl)aminobenzene 5'-phosphate synthase